MKLWISRDKDGALYLWRNKPIRQNDTDRFMYGGYIGGLIRDLFPEITFENSPQKVELELKTMATKNIKTWEDIVNMDNRYHQLIDEIIRSGYSSLWDSKVINKVIATLKISKIIEFGYGGIITNDEWEDDTFDKFSIVWVEEFKHPVIRCHCSRFQDDFISFHAKRQAEDFMSYPENVELVKNYNMI